MFRLSVCNESSVRLSVQKFSCCQISKLCHSLFVINPSFSLALILLMLISYFYQYLAPKKSGMNLYATMHVGFQSLVLSLDLTKLTEFVLNTCFGLGLHLKS